MGDSAFTAEAFDVIDEIQDLTSETDVGCRVSEFVARFGFKSILCVRLPLPKERLKPYTIFDTWPKDFYQTYDARRYYRDDPIADNAFRTVQPYLWSDVAIDHDRMTRARLVMGESADAGLHAGFCIPVHDVNGFQAVITMAGEKIDLPSRAKIAISVLCLIAFGVMDRHARVASDAPPLSGRERELLTQLGAGRTVAQAATRMGVAESTASTLLVRAREKLGTVNTVHTVVEALRLKQITL